MTGENEIEITVDIDSSPSAWAVTSEVETAFKRIIRNSKEMGDSATQSTNQVKNSFERFVGTARVAQEVMGDFSGSTEDASSATTAFKVAAAETSDAAAFLGSNIGNVALIIPAMVGGLLALGPALLAAGGAAGAATTALAGFGVMGATLKIGLGGVSDAWTAYTQQAKTGGAASGAAGKQAEAAARAVENAEYSLTQAKKQATQASKDLTKAREDEKTRLEELSLSLRAQKFAEADAAKAVQEAEDKLNAARAYGVQSAIADAQDQLDRANLAYDQEKQKTKELNEQQAKADKDGVEGSDQVMAAKQRVADANDQVKRATEAVSDAQKAAASSGGAAAGAVNAFNEAMKKLSPNAQAFVREMISLSQRFDVIKRQVQDRLFAGLDTTLEDLADKWLPKLGPLLGNMADALNAVGKGIAGALGDKDFMSGIMTASKAFADTLKSDIGPAIDHVIHAFGVLAGGSTEPFKQIGGWILQISERFDKWLTSASKSGELKDFMHEAAHSLQQIWDIGNNAFDVLGKFIGILFGQSKKKGGSTLDAINDTLVKISDWLDDPKNVKQIQGIEKDIFKWADAFGQVLESLSDLKSAAGPIFKLLHAGLEGEVTMLKIVKGVWDSIAASIRWIGKNGPGMWDGIKNAFRSAMNWIIDRWNSLHFTIPGFSLFGQQIGGGTIGVGHINHMAAGGAGGGLTLAGENGPELLRLPYGTSAMPASNTAHALAAGHGGGEMHGTLRLAVDSSTERSLVSAVMKALRVEIGTFHGGSAQRALGQAGAS